MTSGCGRDKVVILDRDGTMVIDRGYLADPAGLEFEPGAAEGLRWFQAHGFRLLVASNQSGVGRGLFPLQRVLDMNARLHAMAADIGVTLAAIYVCPHAPQDGCDCRKPAQGLMRRAAAEFDFDPARSVVIGDKQSDVEFGRRAGATTILIAAAESPTTRIIAADHVALDLTAAARAVAGLHSVTD